MYNSVGTSTWLFLFLRLISLSYRLVYTSQQGWPKFYNAKFDNHTGFYKYAPDSTTPLVYCITVLILVNPRHQLQHHQDDFIMSLGHEPPTQFTNNSTITKTTQLFMETTSRTFLPLPPTKIVKLIFTLELRWYEEVEVTVAEVIHRNDDLTMTYLNKKSSFCYGTERSNRCGPRGWAWACQQHPWLPAAVWAGELFFAT